jgi:SAM-dependent methyltransferase
MIELVRDANGSYTCPTDPGEPELRTPRVSVTDAEAEQIAKWCAGLRVVEFGTGLGVSTRAIAKTAAEVITFDVDQWVQQSVWPTLPPKIKTAPSPLMTVEGTYLMDSKTDGNIECRSCHRFVSVKRCGVELCDDCHRYQADAAFIDGCHHRAAVEKDVREAFRLVKPDGLIILHDWNAGDVQDGARDAGFVPFAVMQTAHGLAIGRRP